MVKRRLSKNPHKDLIRQHYRDILASISQEDRTLQNEAINQQLNNLFPVATGKTILAYMPMPMEVDIKPFLLQFFSGGGRVAFPRIEGDDLVFYYPTSLNGPWEHHPWGMDQPFPDEKRWQAKGALTEIIVLVPGLAFSSQGVRLGHGGGYYDRFLATLPSQTRRLGVGFCQQEADILVRESHDVLLDGWVNSQGLS